ncbi:LysR family transcriptional regulator [Leptolyngbya sp. FACHB-671]|uniref:LysR family transcriptional regulator n=1 Tax=Leptolyngbya sp. FACHB-671 TaxID=2692812 RepID=UPI001685EBA8|nr:LysR family transcriptional regulator [Leptolyngbya sp. FACHB-671]MBD2069990.1 LysR family transcriptional regulator [Leptolyngbya sp. FACHB-671]
MTQQFPNLARIDLNQLLALQAILEEKHITRAAARASLSQPAMSRVLGRLRSALGDDLLIRSGVGYERTPRGDRLLQELEVLLPRLNAVIGSNDFDPSTSQQCFRVAGTDYAAAIIISGTVRLCRQSAPGVRVEVVGWTQDSYRDVEMGRCDVALGVGSVPTLPKELKVEVLYQENFVCLMSTDTKFKGKRFSLDEYLRRPHAVVATAEGRQTMIDRPLADLGKQRNVVLQSPYFMSTALSIVGTDLIFTVPMRIALELSKLANFQQVLPPQEISDFPYTVVWHPRLGGNSEQAWFRDQIRATVK